MSDDEKKLEEDEEAEGAEGSEQGEGSEEKPKRSLKKLLMIAVPAVLLLAGAGGGAAWFFGFLGGGDGHSQAGGGRTKAVFYHLPEMLVNLNRTDKRAQYLKIKVALEMSDQKIMSTLEPVLPRIMDTFQIYLRELRSEDLDGSAGVYRLKEELLRRVNLAIAPSQVDRALLKEIIVQ